MSQREAREALQDARERMNAARVAFEGVRYGSGHDVAAIEALYNDFVDAEAEVARLELDVEPTDDELSGQYDAPSAAERRDAGAVLQAWRAR